MSGYTEAMEQITALREKRQTTLWQKVYDKYFCEGLAQDMSLPDAVVYADSKVLETTSALMKGL